MRFTFFLPLVALACSAPMATDSGVPDAGRDGGEAGLDAGSDAGTDAGQRPYTGCTCGDAGVCGTDALGDPLRCCNYQQDSCGANDAGPCGLPVRCSARPPCCFDGTCRPSVSCGGSGLCKSWLGATTPEEGTPCDDGRACSFAVPAVSLPDCVGTDAGFDGDDCGSDRVPAFPSGSSCPREAPTCSALRSGFGGNGGVLQGGRCCPSGTACDFRAGATHLKCLGNFGRGLTSNDVCRAGVCSTDDTSTCP